jgi:hypothetical protein
MGGITIDQLPAFKEMAIRSSGYLWSSPAVLPLISEDCPKSTLEHVSVRGKQRETECTRYWAEVLAARAGELSIAGADLGRLLPVLSMGFVQTQRWPERHVFWSYHGKGEQSIAGNGAALLRNLKELVDWINLERKGGWRETERLHGPPPPLPSAFDVCCAFVIGFPTATPGPNGKTVVVHYCFNDKVFALLARANLGWLVPALGIPTLFENAEFYWVGHPSYPGPAPPANLDSTTLMLGPKPTATPKEIFNATRKILNSCRVVLINHMANNPPGSPRSINFFANNPPAGGHAGLNNPPGDNGLVGLGQPLPQAQPQQQQVPPPVFGYNNAPAPGDADVPLIQPQPHQPIQAE